LFGIVSNSAPDNKLQEALESSGWSADTSFWWPGRQVTIDGLPPAFKGVTAAVEWCIQAASAIHFSHLPQETLVWKLAALMQHASAGESSYGSHEFKNEDCTTLFEQVIVQLHEFPETPKPYRPHLNEPAIDSDERIRLISGLSGSGKTSWASEQAMHTQSMIAYYDASSADSGAVGVGLALARELGARWLPRDALATVMLPGLSATESLRAIDLYVRSAGLDVVVVIDNVHRIGAKPLSELVRACASLRFVLLAQPWEGLSELEAWLDVGALALGGWSIETTAAEFASLGCAIDPAVSDRLRRLTGGLPLYVRNSAGLVLRDFDGNAEAFCLAYEGGELVGRTAQQSILSATFQETDDTERRVAAVLSMVMVGLSRDECLTLLPRVLEVDRADAAQCLTSLIDRGILSSLQAGDILLHDAFRPIANEQRAALGDRQIRGAAQGIRSLLLESIAERPNPMRSLQIVRLLPLTGDIKPIVEFASDEFFREYGLSREFEELIERFALDESQSHDDRLLALDALAFARLSEHDADRAEPYLRRMEDLLPGVTEPVEAISRVAIKRMVVAGDRGDTAGVRDVYDDALRIAAGNETLIRIITYNFALARYRSGQFEEAAAIAMKVAMEYFELLELEVSDVFAKNVPAIVERLGERAADQDNIKHLADSLDLYAAAQNAMGLPAGLARFHALKFYEIAHAVSSLVRVGQDVVDELLGILRDAPEARTFIESTLLPTIERYALLGHLVPVRGQYAVVLAYCGAFELAKKEIDQLEGFAGALSATSNLELKRQRDLIKQIGAGIVKLGARRELAPHPDGYPFGPRATAIASTPVVPRVGRNEPCPCGSGVKYKRCHGA
jgi:hypothetical protein